jgi:hypothetical protein
MYSFTFWFSTCRDTKSSTPLGHVYTWYIGRINCIQSAKWEILVILFIFWN